MIKKYFLFLLSGFGLSFLIFAMGDYSDAQSLSENIEFLPGTNTFIFVQTIVTNSEGQIVTYLTSDKFTNVDLDALENLLDSEASENDPIITIDEKKYQVIQRKQNIPYDKENVIASTMIGHSQDDKLVIVARFAHDGYPIIEGDQVSSIWTFIRPVE